jgi:hypothetical protein
VTQHPEQAPSGQNPIPAKPVRKHPADSPHERVSKLDAGGKEPGSLKVPPQKVSHQEEARPENADRQAHAADSRKVGKGNQETIPDHRFIRLKKFQGKGI